MDFEVKPFAAEHFAEYAAWFADPELDGELIAVVEALVELRRQQ